MGEKGFTGSYGFPGQKGERGRPGYEGNPGDDGDRGKVGRVGGPGIFLHMLKKKFKTNMIE